MATDVMMTGGLTKHESSEFSLWDGVKRVLEPAASLKLTVVLFALSIFLILAGTFAQVDKDIWEVIGLYFRVWWAWVPLQVFFPPSFSPEKPIIIPWGLGIWFPGGKLLGLLLAVNLVSAHVVRFKAVATGTRLFAGFVAIALGCIVTWAIIAAGGNSKGIQADPWLPYSTQWIGYRGALALGSLVALFGFASLCREPLSKSSVKKIRQIFLRSVVAVSGVGLAALFVWILQRGEASRPADASLRILWQLTQGTVASVALLLGCWTVFGKRAGIVLLHGGIGLMMFYELHVALTAVETQMHLAEGERTNYVQDIRTFELAVVDTTDPKQDRVAAIPKSIILNSAQHNEAITHADLPFKIKVSNFLKHSKLRTARKSDKNLATAGNGLTTIPEEAKPGAGTDTDGRIDMPSAYVTLESASDGQPLGTYLVSFGLWERDLSDTVQVSGRSYKLELRPKRYYKPYVFELKDVRKEDYLGTSTPRFYASTVHIVDQDRHVDEEKTIWMNNPLRFADETFYQSGYVREEGSGQEHTTLSVVANSGWMMPYVGCMLVGVGMLFHFLNLLVRFLTKGDTVEVSEEDSERAAKLAAKLGLKPGNPAKSATVAATSIKASNRLPNIFAAVMVLFTVSYIARIARPPEPKQMSFDFYRFGQIPVISQGRAKPIDSAAETALLEISGRNTMFIPEEYEKLSYMEKLRRKDKEKWKRPAVQWLLEQIADTKISYKREIFRVENLELQETIGVKKREGMRYTPEEIREHADELDQQIHDAKVEAKKDRKQLSVYKKKVLELGEKFSTYVGLKLAFGLQNRIGGKTQEEVLQSFQNADQTSKEIEETGQPVYAVGPRDKDEKWHILSRAWIVDFIDQIQKKAEPNKTVALWDDILKSFAKDDPVKFNSAVNELLKMVEENPPRDVKPWVIRLESYLNYVQPFTQACVLYMIAFVFGAMGWLFWPRGFNRAAFGILLVTFVIHSLALYARLVISGRPPVTNLYSSAVFIGWGCVLMGLLFEVIYGIGIGNMVAAVAGYATLLIADGLAADGDTFTVLQAVLDTQFWLATHVTCITLGYATTYLAGLFGVAYIIRGVCTPSLTAQDGRDIHRMIYGTLCFSIFFSFVGTVLGGLWADDSWGRFWGWDPKENAALIIVLWNALALHARWGGMVKERGLAALAVGGNIVVSWSWWGVNALGAGLHSYGFKQGTLLNLALFIAVNLFIIGIGMLPKTYWWSSRRQTAHAI
jgi:ABC-type transport system involved in cytochrome c biogenesis permease subunit